ncbi:MAG: 4-oxalomesaconate tautomerase [Gammaproteobacteria bacterium]|nr:4-oxalomesaconate tautomerase [Gammaproteobacteria bacterium]
MGGIPCSLIRGGTSRGAYFQEKHLPADEVARDALLVRIMGGPDVLQVDGIGGGHPLTSKVAVIRQSPDSGIDVDYLFLQVDPHQQTVSSAQNCGNLLAGVGIFAIRENLVEAQQHETKVRVRMLNSHAVCHLVLQTPGGEVDSRGDTSIDGVPGTSAPIVCNYLDIAGSSCGALLPTGHEVDTFDGMEATCVDNGMPVVVLRASHFGLSGVESPEELDINEVLKQQLEVIRLQAGRAMKLGDVHAKSIPKMCLVSPPRSGGAIMTRTFIPHVCHKSIGVLGAVSVATACLTADSITRELAKVPDGKTKRMQVEHPGGSMEVHLDLDDAGQVVSAGIVRTARLLFSGEVMV